MYHVLFHHGVPIKTASLDRNSGDVCSIKLQYFLHNRRETDTFRSYECTKERNFTKTGLSVTNRHKEADCTKT